MLTKAGAKFFASQAFADNSNLLSARNRRRVFRRTSWTTFSADFAFVTGTFSPDGKISLISERQSVPISLNLHSLRHSIWRRRRGERCRTRRSPRPCT